MEAFGFVPCSNAKRIWPCQDHVAGHGDVGGGNLPPGCCLVAPCLLLELLPTTCQDPCLFEAGQRAVALCCAPAPLGFVWSQPLPLFPRDQLLETILKPWLGLGYPGWVMVVGGEGSLVSPADHFTRISVLLCPRENLPSRFKFKEYCPLVFRNLRERFGIDDQDYQVPSLLSLPS